jgi:hypothetical protein
LEVAISKFKKSLILSNDMWYRTIVLEFKEEFDVDWGSEIPRWVKIRTERYEFKSNYLYMKWRTQPLDNKSDNLLEVIFDFLRRDLINQNIELEETVCKITEQLDYVQRVMTAEVDDHNHSCRSILYSVDSSEPIEIEELHSSIYSKDTNFGGVFGEDTRTPQEYFYEEFGFKFRYYYLNGLRDI